MEAKTTPELATPNEANAELATQVSVEELTDIETGVQVYGERIVGAQAVKASITPEWGPAKHRSHTATTVEGLSYSA